MDSMAVRTGLLVLRRSDPRRLVDAPQLQALLEDLTDPSATISEGDGNSEEDTSAANVLFLLNFSGIFSTASWYKQTGC